MNIMNTPRPHAPEPGFAFEGEWREFLPIAATNLLLTLVTLGFYRFWATARERRYLWSRTRFHGETLEWAGTGKEMLIGFLVALLFFLPLVLFLNFGMQALILRGEPVLATVGGVLSLGALFYLIGVARFRAVRYRLSRTFWRGIRGGSGEPGWSYGVQHLARSTASFFTAGLLVPWTMATLWRARWGAMSFGPHPIGVGGGPATTGLKRRWLLLYTAPFVLMLVGLLMAGVGMAAGVDGSDQRQGSPAYTATLVLGAAAVYVLLPLLFLPYWSAFYRKVVGEMSLGGLRFDFSARTVDWVKLILGHIGLVIVTLGFGLVFIGYRNWSFFARHLEVAGELDPATLSQSTTALQSDAEGLADAFDVGAL